MTPSINVEFQQTNRHAALNIPRERLEALANEAVFTSIDEWGIEDATPRTVVLENQWGDVDTNVLVRRLSAAVFHVVFMTAADVRNATSGGVTDANDDDQD